MRGQKFWVCEECGFRVPLGATATPLSLAVPDLIRLPYPVALTAARLQQALHGPHDVLKALFLLKDCFEACVKYLGAILLVEYAGSPAATAERHKLLLQQMVRPSLGVWVNGVVGDLSHWLLTTARPPARDVAALFAAAGRGSPPRSTPLLERCRDFVKYRNDALGHGAIRSDEAYRADLAAWLPLLAELLGGIAGLVEWRLCLVVDRDRGQAWMGPQPGTGTEPGSFRPQQVGHFVVRGPAAVVVDLFPFVCYLPDSAATERLHFYDSLYRYQATKKEATVLEYDRGERHPRAEPVAGLEAAFSAELLARAFKWHRGRLEIIEGRVASFCEILETHAGIVGRRFVVERVRRFLAENDRGLLVIEGEPGRGKTALVAHLIEEVFGRQVPRPAHFFYRRTAGITDPAVCVNTLYQMLLEAHDLSETEELKRQNSPDQFALKLANLLSQQIAPRLTPGAPQLIFIDALDEADGDAFARIPDPLPAGVYVIVTTRPVAGRAVLAGRPFLHWFNLDDPDLLQENLRDGFEFVQRELAGSDLPQATLDEIAGAGRGNFLVLKLLCRHVRTDLTPEQVGPFLRRLAAGEGHDQLGFIYGAFWQRLTTRCPREEAALLCDVAGVLVLAHAPLPAEVIWDVLRLRAADWDLALRRLSEYLTAIPVEEDGVRVTFYRIYHESFADFLRARLAADRQRLTDQLAEYCRRWGWQPEGYGRRYALRYGPRHLVAAGRAGDAADLLRDLAFLEAKATADLVFELPGDFAMTTAALPAGDHRWRWLELIEEALRRDLHFMARHPGTLFQCLWNSGWWYDGSQPERTEPTLAELLESWRATRARGSEPSPWLRSHRPPPVPLGTALRAVLRGHQGEVIGVAFSPEGSRLVSGGADQAVRVWDAHRGNEIACLMHKGGVNSVAFAGRDHVVFGSGDRKVWMWSPATGEAPRPLRGHAALVSCVAVSPDGQRLLSGSHDATARVWDAQTLTEVMCLRGLGDSVRSATFTADGFALGIADGMIRLYDSSGGETGCLRGHQARVKGLAVSPDGTHLASGSADGTIRVWDLRQRRELVCWPAHADGVSAVAFSPDGRLLASGGGDREVHVRRLPEKETIRLRGHEERVTGVAFSPDGRWLASSSADGTVRTWDPRRGHVPPPLPDHDDLIECLAFSADGRLLASAAVDGGIRLWEGMTGQPLRAWRGHEGVVRGLAFSADERWLVSGADDEMACVWDVQTGGRVLGLRGHGDAVTGVAFTTDGQRIVTGGLDGCVRIWDASRGGELLCLRGHQAGVTAVAVSGDDRRIASASWDWTIRLWDAVSGTELISLGSEGEWIDRLGLSRDSQRLAAATAEGVVRVWDLSGAETVCVATHAGIQDVAALAAGPLHFPWRAASGGGETAIFTAVGGEAVAWFPAALLRLAAHPSGRSWAGAAGKHVCLFTLY